jgi:hypothetical protein
MSGIVADHIRSQGAVEHETAAFKDILHDRRRIHRKVGRLAQQLIVERFKRRVQRQKKHAQPFDLLQSRPRMAFQARHIMHRDIVDDVGLTGFEPGDSCGVFGDFFEDHLLDFRFRAPVVVVARHDKVAASLKAHELIRPGADRVLVHLVAVLVRGRLAEDEAVLHAIEEDRIGLLQDENQIVVIHRLHLNDILEVFSLQAVFVRLHAVDGKITSFDVKGAPS